MRWYSNGMSTQAVSALTISILLACVETYADVITAVTPDGLACERLFELSDSIELLHFGKLNDVLNVLC